MRKRTVKMTAMAVLASGCMFGIGCLNLGGIFGTTLRAVPAYAALSFLTDNNAIFDLFPDGGATTTTTTTTP